jgi:hypothetical protein
MGGFVNLEPVSKAPPVAVISREMQQLWFSLARQRWSSLVIVPARGASSPLAMANSLVQIARRSTPDWRCSLIDAMHVTADGLSEMAQAIARNTAAQERVLVVVSSIDDNPPAMAVVSFCDAALLCVTLDTSDLASSRDTLERCGRERFIGSVVLVPNNRR